MIRAQIDVHELKLVRMERLYSRYGAADRCEVDVTVIDAWESGEREITFADMQRIAAGYRLTDTEITAIFGIDPTLLALSLPIPAPAADPPPAPVIPPEPPPTTDALPPLTERAALVWRMVQEQHSIAEIADALAIRPASAKQWIQRITARVNGGAVIPAVAATTPDPVTSPPEAPAAPTPPRRRVRVKPEALADRLKAAASHQQQLAATLPDATTRTYRVGNGTVSATLSPRWLLLPAPQRAALCETLRILEDLDALARR